MAKAKGSPKTGGRKAGTPNKFTGDIKAAIAAALWEAGGKDYLVRLADADPRTFCTLVGKLVPLEVEGAPDSPLQHVVRIITGVPRSA
jgi:hypothetical protein